MTTGAIDLRQRTWATPVLDFIIGSSLKPVPAFPLDVLGPFWSGFICDSAGTNLPRDFFAGTLLGTVSTLIGNARTAVLPAPSTQEAPATLWIINVGAAGTGKTPAFKPFLKCVNALETDYDCTIKIEDSTIAGSIRELTLNPHGIGVMNDELSGWWDSFKVDRQGEQFWLKAYNGTLPYTVSRGNRGSVTIPRHNLSVVGGTQPATLPTMMEATSGIERGFVSRCMFLYPDKPSDQLGTGKTPDVSRAESILARVYGLQPLAEWMPRPLPVAKAAAQYHAQWWDNLRGLWIDGDSPEGFWIAKQQGTALRLALVLEVLWWASASNADPAIIAKAQAMAAMADPARNSNDAQRKVAQAKLEAFCAKHGLDADHLTAVPPRDGPATIGLRAMKAACSLISDYFHPHFERAQGDAYAPVKVAAAKALCLKLARVDAEAFNARELHKYEAFGKVHAALHGTGGKDMVDDVCDYLVERNIIRRLESGKTGRKGQNYEVNRLLAIMLKRARR